MEKYLLTEVIGEGTFGCVYKGLNRRTDEIVAIKRLKSKYSSWKKCLNLREVKSMRVMNHPNIVKLKEVVQEFCSLYFIFEYMEGNLCQLMETRGSSFYEADVRNMCFQVFQALSHMHSRGYFHRDLKPENLLVTNDTIKIGDFGSACEITSQRPLTDYITTRWYRAPEVLLHSDCYDSKVDMWAMGAIIAEMFSLRPLFAGHNEADQIYKICRVIGTPTVESWADGVRLASDINYQFPKFSDLHLSTVLRSASDDAVSLIDSLCSWDPCKRPTADEALQHPFFRPCYNPSSSLRSGRVLVNRSARAEEHNLIR